MLWLASTLINMTDLDRKKGTIPSSFLCFLIVKQEMLYVCMLSETFHLIVKYDMDSYLEYLSLLNRIRKKKKIL